MISQLTGNGRVLLTVNEEGAWSELFYPYPGQFQHLREMRLGLYDVDRRKFTWLIPGSGFEGRAVPSGVGRFPGTEWRGDGIRLSVEDLVHPNHDLVLRVLRVTAEPARPLRLFTYESLKIAESLYQETAYSDPASRSLVHYKRGYFFEFFSEPDFDRSACGEHTVKGLQGTYVDAEDGFLEGRSIAHGAADSALQWDLAARPDEETVIRIFLALGRSAPQVHQLRDYVREGGGARFENEAQAFWQTWVKRRLPKFPGGFSERAEELYSSSILVLRHATGVNGSIIASPDTASLVVGGDTYNYCWWRDGGYISKAMDEAGLYESSQRFLEFALACQSPDGSFLHRHFPDGAVGSTWHPPPFLQVDQTATIVSAVWHHFKHGSDPDALLGLWPLVKAAANFLAEFRDPATGLPAPSFDLWEERKGIHAYSTATVVHALERAARIAEELGKDHTRWRAVAREMGEAAVEEFWDPRIGRFIRSISPRDERLDASILPALKLGLLPWGDPRAREVVDSVERRLWSPTVGGIARYEGDEYYGRENPWIISTLWLAEARLHLGDRDRCHELLEWVAAHATPTQLLPEQVDATTAQPRSATPLVWSHSTFVDVVHKFRRALDGDGPLDE